MPRAIAASALHVDIAQITRVERIKHGLTNESWRVHASDADAVIVRISNAAEELLRIDRRSEARVLAAVSAAGLGPDILVCDPERRVLVTRDLGATWSEEDAHVRRNIQRIAALLSRLHALQAPREVRRVDLAETVEGYLRSLDERGHRSELMSASMRTRSRDAATALLHNSRERLCHNDVHHLNIVENRSLHLIDWEYSGLGEPLFDLASLCIYHRYGSSEREQLLSAYLTASDPSARQRLELACWLFEYVRELWSAVRGVDG